MKTVTEHGLFIDNESVPAASGATFDSVDPATARTNAALAEAGPADVEAALAGAGTAAEGWWAQDARRRARVLNAWAELIERDADHLAAIESADNGRPIRETRSQSGIVAQWYRYFAGIADKAEGTTIPVGDGHLNYTERVPLGVVAAITPWNHPLLIASKKLAPALAAGNAVILKPSELASLSLLELARLGREAGLPPGVLQVLTGGGQVGAALAAHRGIVRVDVTGSTRTGMAVAAAAGQSMKQFAGELGGKAPVLVFEDADLDRAVRGVQFAGFIAAGQTCIAGTRILVQRSVYDEFLARLAERVGRMRVGLPSNHTTQMGPQISAAARERIEGYVASGLDEGAQLLTGGRRPDDPALADGFFLTPTVLTGGDNGMRVAQEEIFGPVLLVMSFGDEAEAVRIANDVPFGLGGAVWTANVARAHRVARQMRSGTIWINDHHRNDPGSPWGGFGDSGVGRENGFEALLGFTAVKSVWVNLGEEPITWYDDTDAVRLN